MAAVANDKSHWEEEIFWSICRMPFWHSSTNSTTSTTVNNVHQKNQNKLGDPSSNHHHSSNLVSSMAMSLFPIRRRLSHDPWNKLYFPYEPGKQARSAIRIKNTSKFHVAFKFQTTVPKSCYMSPPGGILAPGENILATVFKFVEQPENNKKVVGQKSWAKFKIMSLKVNGEMDYVPE